MLQEAAQDGCCGRDRLVLYISPCPCWLQVHTTCQTKTMKLSLYDDVRVVLCSSLLDLISSCCWSVVVLNGLLATTRLMASIVTIPIMSRWIGLANSSLSFFFETQYTRRRSQMHAHSSLWIHARNPTPISKLADPRNWRSHHRYRGAHRLPPLSVFAIVAYLNHLTSRLLTRALHIG